MWPTDEEMRQAEENERTGQWPGGGIGRPEIVCLCGSMSNPDGFFNAAVSATKSGAIVVTPFGPVDTPIEDLRSLQRERIKLADRVVVIPKADGKVGEDTAREADYAESIGKVVTYVMVRVPATPANDGTFRA